MSLIGMRIALVGPLPPPAGGMANQTRQLAELLGSAGARVQLVQTNPPYRPACIARVQLLRAGVRLLAYLGRLWAAAGRNDVMHLMANSGWSWHLFAAPALWVARLRGLPVIVNYRGGEAGPFLERSARIVRASMSRSAQLVVPSAFLQQVFAQHGMSANIVPNIVDLQRFRPRPGPARGEPTIMVARNLERIYDNASALRAFALVVQDVPSARLVIAGTGPEGAALKQLATDLKVSARVEFVGRLDRDDMACRLRECRLALNPSRIDNMPNSVLEALASGVPVVSTNVGGVPFIVQDERTALLVDAGDVSAMAQAMLRVLREPALAARLSQAGIAEVQRYAWNGVAPMLERSYRGASGSTRRSRS